MVHLHEGFTELFLEGPEVQEEVEGGLRDEGVFSRDLSVTEMGEWKDRGVGH